MENRMNISKAFGKVPHRRLITKLDYYGIRGSLLHWFESLPTQRTQSVVTEGASSSPVVTTSGVPQRTVLGSLLFLMYINDFTDGLNYRLFSDDALLYGTICCDKDTADLQDYLYRLAAWQRKWKRNLILQSARSYALQAREIHQSRNTYSVEKF